MRVATRFDWHAVAPPSPLAGLATRYYVANPAPEIALNAWRMGGYWRWGILAFLDGRMLVYRDGEAPTLGEAKLRAESALPANVPAGLWDYRPNDKPDPMGDDGPDDLPF